MPLPVLRSVSIQEFDESLVVTIFSRFSVRARLFCGQFGGMNIKS